MKITNSTQLSGPIIPTIPYGSGIVFNQRCGFVDSFMSSVQQLCKPTLDQSTSTQNPTLPIKDRNMSPLI